MGDVVGNRAELEQLLNRARALISNAGDGDWNRESAEWQLAAAELLRDMDGRATPDPFVLEQELTPEAAVMRTIGAASTCWTEIRHAGVFDSTRAQQIGEELLRWLRHRYEQPEAGWPEQDPESTQAIDAAAITGGTLSAPVDGARVEVNVEHGVRAFDVHGQQVAPMTPEQQQAALDPDGDLEGYDGPTGRPGGYCFGPDSTGDRPGSHLVGADKDCPRCGGWYSPELEQRNAELEAGRGLGG